MPIRNSSGYLFRRYIWLITTVAQAGKEGLTYEHISRLWSSTGINESPYGEVLPLRTLQQHILAIKNIFGIVICGKRINGECYYRLNFENDNVAAVQNSLIDSLSLNDTYYNNRESFNDNVVLEPHGRIMDFMSTILEAIEEKRCIEVVKNVNFWDYQEDANGDYGYKFISYDANLVLEPLYVRQFNGEWYVAGSGVSRNGEERDCLDYKFPWVLKLVDITTCRKTQMGFKKDRTSCLYPDFFFSDKLGVKEFPNHMDKDTIEIDVNSSDLPFFLETPIHHSQTENTDGIAVNIQMTKEFIELMREYSDVFRHVDHRHEWVDEELKEQKGTNYPQKTMKMRVVISHAAAKHYGLSAETPHRNNLIFKHLRGDDLLGSIDIFYKNNERGLEMLFYIVTEARPDALEGWLFETLDILNECGLGKESLWCKVNYIGGNPKDGLVTEPGYEERYYPIEFSDKWPPLKFITRLEQLTRVSESDRFFRDIEKYPEEVLYDMLDGFGNYSNELGDVGRLENCSKIKVIREELARRQESGEPAD